MPRRLYLLWTLGVLAATLWVPAANAGVSGQGGGLLTQTTTRLNHRAGPGTDWQALTVLEANTPILLDGKSFGGTWARGITPSGSIGWVATEFLAAAPAVIQALPDVAVEAPFTLPPPSADGGGGLVPEGQPSGFSREFIATANVNVRTAPDTNAQRLTTIFPNTPVVVDGRDASGLWLRGRLPEGTVGYIFAIYVNIPLVDIPALPIVTGGASAAPVSAGTETLGNSPRPLTGGGFAYGGHVSSFGNMTVNRMHEAGMTWVKRQLRYTDGDDPAVAAGMINDAHAKGFNILLGIVGGAGDVTRPGYFERYAAFVGGVAALGADGIEVWNEQNISREWQAGQIDPARYTELLRLSFNAIKATNPNTLVVSGAPAPTGFFGGCSTSGCDDNLYVQGMATAGAANFMDCVGVHYNEGILPPTARSGDPRGSSSHYTRYYGGMIDTYRAAFGGSRPLCFTELGYLSPEGYGPLPAAFAWAADVSAAEQAAWLDQAVSMAPGRGVRLLIIWNVDFAVYGDDPQAGYAIMRPDGSCPACAALAS